MEKREKCYRYDKLTDNKNQDEQLYNYFLNGSEYIKLCELKPIEKDYRRGKQVPADAYNEHRELELKAFYNMVRYMELSIEDGNYKKGLRDIIRVWAQSLTNKGLVSLMESADLNNEYTKEELVEIIPSKMVERYFFCNIFIQGNILYKDLEELTVEEIERIYQESLVEDKIRVTLEEVFNQIRESSITIDGVISAKKIRESLAEKTACRGLKYTYTVSSALYREIFDNIDIHLVEGKAYFDKSHKKYIRYAIDYTELSNQMFCCYYKKYKECNTLVRELYAGIIDFVFNEFDVECAGCKNIEERYNQLNSKVIKVEIPLTKLHRQMGNKKSLASNSGSRELYRALIEYLQYIHISFDLSDEYENYKKVFPRQIECRLLEGVVFQQKKINNNLSDVVTIQANGLMIYLYCKNQFRMLPSEINVINKNSENKRKVLLYYKTQINYLLGKSGNHTRLFSNIQKAEHIELFKKIDDNETKKRNDFRNYCVTVLEHIVDVINESDIDKSKFFAEEFEVEVRYDKRHPDDKTDAIIVKEKEKKRE